MISWSDLGNMLLKWLPGFLTAIGLGIYIGISRWVASYQSGDEAKSQRQRDIRTTERQDKEIDRAWSRVDALEEDKERVEKDRDRGWDLARGWFDVAHQERHGRNNLLMTSGRDALDPLPGLEELEGRMSSQHQTRKAP